MNNTNQALVQGFLDRVYVSSHSQNTVKAYEMAIKHFAEFVGRKYQRTDLEMLDNLKNGKHDVYDVLRDFVVDLDKRGYKPRSLNVWVPAIKEYLRYHKIKIYSEDFKQTVKMPKRARTVEEPLTKEILVRLLRSLPSKLQAAVLIAVASGVRIGELVQLRIRDIDFNSRPCRVLIRAETTKGKVGRETYLTAEACTSLKDYLSGAFGYKENASNDSIKDMQVFAPASIKKKQGEYRTDPTLRAVQILESSLRWYVRKIPELDKLNENGRKAIHFHAFRKYFRTVVGNTVGRDYAEALLGHIFYLDTYYNLPQEERRKMYLKAEPYLTISDYTKIEKDLSKIVERQREIEAALAKLGVKFPKLLEKELQEVVGNG